METGGYHRFGDVPEWEGEPVELFEPIAVKQRDEEKSPVTAAEFWRVVLGGLDSEFVDRFDELGYRQLSQNDPS